jgi:uncharacterized membrane protein YoaK (UPF0700 family)
MDTAFEVIRFLSIGAFLFFGIGCLVSRHMVDEFERYGLPRFRLLVGLLEVTAAVGLALARAFPPLLIPTAGGLALLMFMGMLTRIRLRDSIVQMLPALMLLLMNGFLVLHALR